MMKISEFMQHKVMLLEDYDLVLQAQFSEEIINIIFEKSCDKLQRLMAMEIARLKGYALAREPQPDDKELA